MDKIGKDIIRSQLKNSRKNLSINEKKTLDSLIFQRLITFAPFAQADSIFSYMPHDNEVDTRAVIEAHLLKKTFILPSVRGEELHLYKLNSLDELKKGEFGIHEPAEQGNQHDHHLLEVALVPGIAFDESGHRIGYGGGFFDRFLKKMENINCTTIGLAYEFQIIDKVPIEPYDVPVHYIITEQRTIICPPYKRRIQ
ncbi:5-formyltetrahydrofolate cyclo-ligase [Candidatus Gracilibacteria bacterium]|nr:5-formyltetrahydrofolate cyclo-ligase [Candidatus Gracilibacteria bacterium]